MRRRQLLADLAAAAGATAVAPKLLAASPARASATDDPGALLVTRIEDVLIGPRLEAAPVTLPTLRRALTSVVGDFQACRYAHLADQLPRLLTTAEATYDHASGIDRQHAAAVLAQTYNVTTRMLIKLDENHIAWISGDRARTTAEAGGNALPFAEATRNLCILTRTAGRHERARDLAIDAAQRLEIGGGQRGDPRHLSQYGLLYSTAGYSAAKTGDRTESTQLLDEAAAAASRLTGDTGHHWMGFGTSGVRLYRISAALVLGDAGTAIDHARHIRPEQLPTVERRARYWVDIARAFAMWGKHDHCYRAVLAAERAAPEETRSLPVVRTLVTTLLANQHRCAMPGLAEKLLAESMQAFIRIGIDERNETFHKLREQLHDEICNRYAGRVPTKYLKVPYGSRVHEELFTLLLQRRGKPVQAALLRVSTGDSVHTERRVRELRELGLDIRSTKESGYDLYTLSTLEIDTTLIPTIVSNIIKKDRFLPEAERRNLLRKID